MAEPVTLAQAIEQLRVTGDDETDLIERLIVAARSHIEHATGLTLVERRVTQTFDRFCTPLRLSAWPVIETPAATLDIRDPATGAWTLASGTYMLMADRYPAMLMPAIGTSWPTALNAPQSVRVSVTAGYPEGNCPLPLVQAIHLLVGHWYENREAVVTGVTSVEVQFGVDLLTQDFRRLL